LSDAGKKKSLPALAEVDFPHDERGGEEIREGKTQKKTSAERGAGSNQLVVAEL